jgi:TRAP-type C4-dicarboxylate transport system substrate-binding protein
MTMIKRGIFGGAAAVALAAGSAMAAERWDMPMAYPDSNFHTENAKEFASCVADQSGGELEIVIHGGGSLFGGADIKRAVQTGQALIGERLLSAHANEHPLFGIDSIPFLASSYAESEQLWQATRPALEELLDSQNMVLLYTVPWPPQGLYTKKDIDAAADLQGVKFRAYNAATARMAELTGAVPVQIEAAELSQALATGVAESFISSGSTGHDSKVWEQLTHWYEVNAWLPRNHILVNKQAWEALDDDVRQALLDCGSEAEARGTAESKELNDWYKEQLMANGMTVVPPGDQLRSDLEAIGATMTEEWLATAGDGGKAVIDDYRSM